MPATKAITYLAYDASDMDHTDSLIIRDCNSYAEAACKYAKHVDEEEGFIKKHRTVMVTKMGPEEWVKVTVYVDGRGEYREMPVFDGDWEEDE